MKYYLEKRDPWGTKQYGMRLIGSTWGHCVPLYRSIVENGPVHSKQLDSAYFTELGRAISGS